MPGTMTPEHTSGTVIRHRDTEAVDQLIQVMAIVIIHATSRSLHMCQAKQEPQTSATGGVCVETPAGSARLLLWRQSVHIGIRRDGFLGHLEQPEEVFLL